MSILGGRRSAAWRHLGLRTGFEVAFLEPEDGGMQLHGWTTAVEGGRAWQVDYSIGVDATWTTRMAKITSRSVSGTCRVLLEGDGAGSWRVDGRARPDLEGCLDVDLEASALTNALPVLRLALAIGTGSAAPAVYVRAEDAGVVRLEQRFTRVGDLDGRHRYDYSAPAFDFTARLIYDDAGLVVDYPGIAERVG